MSHKLQKQCTDNATSYFQAAAGSAAGAGMAWDRTQWVEDSRVSVPQSHWQHAGCHARDALMSPAESLCRPDGQSDCDTTASRTLIQLQCNSNKSVSAINMALPVFAAECCTAAPVLLAAHCCWSISPARTTLSSKPAACRCCCQWWERQTDAWPLHRPCSTYYSDSVNYSSRNNWHHQITACAGRCIFWVLNRKW